MNGRPRLILLAAYGGPYDGSFIPMIRALCEGAAGRGWTARAVFSPDAGTRPWFSRLGEDHDVMLSPDADRGELGEWIRRELLAEPGPVLLHTHFTRYDLPALAAARGRPRTAVLWHVHTPLHGGPRATARAAIKYGLLGRRTQAILASGEEPAATVRGVGAPRGRLAVVGSAVRAEAFPLTGESEREAARSTLAIPKGTTLLLHFGWEWALKDGDLFLATMSELAARRDGGELVGLTVGVDPAAEAALSKAGLGDLVRRVDPRDDVRTLYAAADVFVSSSRVEGEPFAVIEAILSGLPVAATDLPGHSGVCDGLPSCRIAGRGPAEMAAAISELLLREPAQARAERVGSRERVAERFGLGPWAERMLERYEAALSRAS